MSAYPPAIAPILTDSRGMFLFKDLDAAYWRLFKGAASKRRGAWALAHLDRFAL